MNASDKNATAAVIALRVGSVAPLGPNAVPSGYVKHAAAGPVHAGALGLAGDAQADLRVHGGPDKAVYGYPASRYPEWAAEFPHLAFASGAMGENLTLSGGDERDVHIGDRWRIGGAVLQVTQPRQPCFKLGLALGDPALVRAMTRSGRCGWYYRVLDPGDIAAGDVANLIARPNPDWPIARFAAIVAARAMTRAVFTAMVAMEGLAEQWQLKALRRLAELRVGPEGFEPPTKPL